MPDVRTSANRMPHRSFIARRGSDVLKVGHHGSAYSSAPGFIAAVHPRFAVISAGRHNLFGHPAVATLATLRNAGTTTYRTDRCGAVIVEPTMDTPTMTVPHC